MPLPQDFCSLLVIDGDAIPYILGWFNREHAHVEMMYQAIDTWMHDFLTITGAPQFLGILAAPQSHCFRYAIYKYKPYKGNRQEKDEWIKFWEPIVKDYLVDKYHFKYAPDYLETDDVVATLALGNPKAIICSPDKDLRQIPGYFYNYKDFGGEKHPGLETVDLKQATRNLHMQLLTGDGVDNINGITNMGEVKANKLLNETNPMLWTNAVKMAYQKQYGPHYGDIIYQQTLETIQMITPDHPLWSKFGFDVEHYLAGVKNSVDYVRSIHRTIEQETFM
jgi:hypothetical protein